MESVKSTISQKSFLLLNELIDSIRNEEVSAVADQSLQLRCLWEEEARFKALSNVMLCQAARLRIKVNQFASINAALPNEIIAHIFELGAQEDIEQYCSFPVFSRAMSHVCRLWREISLATPALWTLSCPRLPLDLTMRAKESLLDVVLPYTFNVLHDPAMIGPSLSRARSLRVLLNDENYEDFSWIESQPAPHLSTFRIRCYLRPANPMSPSLGVHLSFLTYGRCI